MRQKQHFSSRSKSTKKRAWLFISAALFIGGVYLLITTLAPTIPPSSQSDDKYTKNEDTQVIKENRVYIPAIGVDVAIAEEDSPSALEKGAWHRKPQNGDPQKGGNFVLSAHRFEMGWTPQQTRARSPFYHIDKVEPGDKIFVDYDKKRYTYEVAKKYKVDRYAVQIEDPSKEPKLTLYSCDRAGEAAGREVIEAKPI